MRILQVNKFMYRRAGAEAYMLDLSRMLAGAGHEVAYFGMHHPENIKTPWSKFFVNEIHYDRREGVLRDVKKVAHLIWSTEARSKFSRLLNDFNPEIVHIHNIYHQISPSILPECRRRRIPVVMTAHDYHLISPNYSLFTRGQPCSSCLGNSFWRTVAHNCLDSWPKTMGGALEHLVHRALDVYEKNLRIVICPSWFMAETLARHGVPKEKLVHLPNFISPQAPPPAFADTRGVLYAGRLVREKGVWTLLDAAARLPEIPFLIAGDGPLRESIAAAVLSRRITNVRLLGFQSKNEIQHSIASARLVAVPSIWYENFPYAALEPMAAGKVVIGSKIGGIPEIIRDRENGILAPPGDASALVDAIKSVYYDDRLRIRLGERAARDVRKFYDPQEHLRRIVQIYEGIR